MVQIVFALHYMLLSVGKFLVCVRERERERDRGKIEVEGIFGETGNTCSRNSLTSPP